MKKKGAANKSRFLSDVIPGVDETGARSDKVLLQKSYSEAMRAQHNTTENFTRNEKTLEHVYLNALWGYVHLPGHDNSKDNSQENTMIKKIFDKETEKKDLSGWYRPSPPNKPYTRTKYGFRVCMDQNKAIKDAVFEGEFSYGETSLLKMLGEKTSSPQAFLFHNHLYGSKNVLIPMKKYEYDVDKFQNSEEAKLGSETVESGPYSGYVLQAMRLYIQAKAKGNVPPEKLLRAKWHILLHSRSCSAYVLTNIDPKDDGYTELFVILHNTGISPEVVKDQLYARKNDIEESFLMPL